MRSFRQDTRGISETLGALLLVLIVVSAAASFAVFVQAKQTEVQRREMMAAERDSENLAVLSLQPTLDAPGTGWARLSFAVANLGTSAVQVTGLQVNDQPLENYTVYRLDPVIGSLEEVPMQGGWMLNLSARERLHVNVTVATDFYGNVTIGLQDYVKLELLSGRLRTYERVFLPPTAIGLVEVRERWDATLGDYVPVVLLDARESDHPDPAARIVSWSWLINATGPDTRDYTGRYVKTDFVAGTSYTVQLTVKDSFGLIAVDAFTVAV